VCSSAWRSKTARPKKPPACAAAWTWRPRCPPLRQKAKTLQTLRALPAPPNRFEPRFEPGGRIRLRFRFHGGESSPHHSLRLPSRLKLHPFRA